MPRFTRCAVSTPAILTAPVWLPFYLALALLLLVGMLAAMVLTAGAFWLEMLVDDLANAAKRGTDMLIAWFARVTGWRS